MATSPPIASAWVELVPEMTGFQRALSREMGEATRPMRESSRSFAGVVGRTVAGATLAVGAAVAGVAATVAGLALKGGLDRALAIEQAEAKLKGLGHSVEGVESIMQDALASVRGTAFGLGEAAGVAATIVASGVRPGEQLEKTLRLVADAATIAGTDMGSMGAIFAKVAASNKLQMDTINQLHDAGIPALALVAEQLGVTAEEASAMASRGEIDFATFSAAMEQGLGGAALSAGETFTGAMANVRAALSRLGAQFWTPVLEAFTPVLGNLQGLFDDLGVSLEGPFASWAGSAQWAAEKVDGAITWLRDRLQGGFTMPSVDGILDTLRDFNPVLGGAAAAFMEHLPTIQKSLRGLGKGLQESLSEALDEILPVLPDLAGAFADLAVALIPLIPAAADLLKAVLPLVPALVELLEQVIPPLTDALEDLTPAFADFVEVAAASMDFSMLAILPQILDGIDRKDIDGLTQSFREFFATLGVDFDLIVEVVARAMAKFRDNVLLPVGEVVATVRASVDEVKAVVGDAWAVVTTITGTAWETVKQLVSGAVLVILALFRGDFSSIQGIVSTVLGNIAGSWSKASEQVGGIVSGLVGRVRSWFSDMMTGAANLITGGARVIEHKFNGIRVGIGKAFANAPSLLFQAGRDIVGGLINGIGQMVGQAGVAAAQLAGRVVSSAKASLGIKSPSRVFREIGAYTAEGMLLGLEDGAPAVASAMDSMLAVPSPSASSVAVGAAAGGGRENIYTETGTLLAWIERAADGVARMVWNELDAQSALSVRQGVR